jgi:hypothetical protein
MAKIHGRKGSLYANLTSGGTAEQIAYLTEWSLDMSSDKVDVTAFGDTNKTYVAGLSDASGAFSGFYDNSTAQIFTAAGDGVARKLYLYPDTSNTGQYWYGTGFLDGSVSVSNSDAVKITGSFSAASAFTKIG